MAWFVFEVISELALFGFLPLFATAATVWFVWRLLETIDPEEVKHSKAKGELDEPTYNVRRDGVGSNILLLTWI